MNTDGQILDGAIVITIFCLKEIIFSDSFVMNIVKLDNSS
jgi:hypothetical protein